MTRPLAHRIRRLAGPLILPVAFVCGDLAVRGRRLASADPLHLLGYGGTVLASVAIWGSLVVAASSRSRLRSIAAVTLVAGAIFASATQIAFWARWRVYASLDALVESDTIFLSLIASMRRDAPYLAFGTSCGGLAMLLAFKVARRYPLWPKMGAVPAVVLPVVAWTIAFAIPVSYRGQQTSTPDTIYFHALRTLVGVRLHAAFVEPRLVRVQLRDPLAVPRLEAQPAARRNVLFILQEAQRADVTCIDHVPDCKLATKRSNDAAPGRIGFRKMRSVGSSTAVVIATLWSGLSPVASRTDLHSAPLLWDYAHAAGLRTAYFTSQNLMFQNARLFVQDLPLDRTTSGTEIVPEADWLAGAPDGELTGAFLRSIDGLGEPYFAVVHYSNIHKPRVIDPNDAPFQPTATEYDKEQTPEQKNFYRNAVHASDGAVAKLIDGVREHPSGARTVIFFISDHAESHFEHGQDNDHSGSVFDEEIHVPAWIDAPEGTLTPAERRALERSRDDWLLAYDVAPTMLDLMGTWDAAALTPFREKMPGQPLTRPRRAAGPLPLTNVSWVWEYRTPNWGMIDGPMKVEARAKDAAYRCFNLEIDPREKNDLGESACPELVRAAHATFHMMPRDLGRLANRPDWGGGL